MRKKGVSKYGFKLEDFSNHADYTRAIRAAYKSSAKGKLANDKYHKGDKFKLRMALYIKNPNVIAKNLIACSKYRSTLKGSANRKSIKANYRASKLQRTPAWADLEAIKQFYLNCPKGYHVDHDVPLQGVNISGLHVLNNLVYLTAEDNLKKGNKWPHNYSAQNGSNSKLAIV